jgi:hypothetical protein
MSKPNSSFPHSLHFEPTVVQKVQDTLLATPVSQASYTIMTNPDYVVQFAIAYGNRSQLLALPTFAHHEDGMPIALCSKEQMAF